MSLGLGARSKPRQMLPWKSVYQEDRSPNVHEMHNNIPRKNGMETHGTHGCSPNGLPLIPPDVSAVVWRRFGFTYFSKMLCGQWNGNLIQCYLFFFSWGMLFRIRMLCCLFMSFLNCIVWVTVRSRGICLDIELTF